MPLPHRRQQFAKFVAFHDLTYADVAQALGIEPNEVRNLAKGARYPSPREIEGIVKLFAGMPIEVMFERSMLKYRDATEWPPKGPGFRPVRSYQ